MPLGKKSRRGHSCSRSPVFPRVIGGGKEDLGVQGGLPVSGELLPVIVRNRMDLGAQGFEPLHCRTVRRLGRGPGQPRRR